MDKFGPLVYKESPRYFLVNCTGDQQHNNRYWTILKMRQIISCQISAIYLILAKGFLVPVSTARWLTKNCLSFYIFHYMSEDNTKSIPFERNESLYSTDITRSYVSCKSSYIKISRTVKNYTLRQGGQGQQPEDWSAFAPSYCCRSSIHSLTHFKK